MKTNPSRRLRYDFFRGVALLFICFDHIVFQSNGIPFWGMVTPWYWGLSDAAEIFIFVSGLTFALVYARRLDTYGILKTVRAGLVRIWQLYRTYLVLVFLSIGSMIGLSSLFQTEIDALGAFVAAPLPETFAIVSLSTSINILPLYMVLIILALPALMLLRWAPHLTLGMSFGIYVLSQLVGPSLGGGLFADWTFHPLAYQLLFVLGMYVVVTNPPLPIHWGVVVGTSVLLLGVALQMWLVPRLVGHGLLSPASILNIPMPTMDATQKTMFGVHRLFYFLGLAYVVTVLTPAANAFWNRPLWRPVLITGQHSLSVYCFGELLAVTLGPLSQIWGLSPLATLAVALGGCGLLVGFAYSMRWWKAPLRRRPSPPRTPRPASDLISPPTVGPVTPARNT